VIDGYPAENSNICEVEEQCMGATREKDSFVVKIESMVAGWLRWRLFFVARGRKKREASGLLKRWEKRRQPKLLTQIRVHSRRRRQ
jgi:hypothetical protein